MPGNGPKYGNYYFGKGGFFYKKQVGVGGRKNPKYGVICNQPQYLYNKYKPGNTGVGAQSTANRRAKNRLSTICGPQNSCGNFYNYLGRYDPYLYNANGYVQVPVPENIVIEHEKPKPPPISCPLLPKNTGYETCSPWPQSGGIFSSNTRLSPFNGPHNFNNDPSTFNNPDHLSLNTTPVIAADGTIYVCSGNNYGIYENYLYAINPNLTLKWKSRMFPSNNFLHVAISKNGIVWVALNNANNNSDILYAFSPNPTGMTDVQPLGFFENINHGYSNLSIGNDGTLYFISDKLFAFDTNQYTGSLQPKWSTPVINDIKIYNDIAIDNQGIIYTVALLNSHRFLYAYSPNQTTGDFNVSPSRTYILPNTGYISITIGNVGTIYINGYFQIYAFDPNQSTPKWTYPTTGTKSIIGIAFNNLLYAVDNVDGLISLDTNGNATPVYSISGLNTVPCIGQDGTVYVGRVTDSSVYAISQNGTATVLATFMGEFTENNRTTGFSIGSDGTLYVPSDDPYSAQPYLAAIKD
jgi:hypothetical protein